MLVFLFVVTILIVAAGIAGFLLKRNVGMHVVSMLLMINAGGLFFVTVDRLTGSHAGRSFYLVIILISIIAVPIITGVLKQTAEITGGEGVEKRDTIAD